MSGGRLGARLFLALAALLALLTALRLGEHRALSAAPDLGQGDGRPTLLFLFQPGDCKAYEGLVRRWSSMAADSAVRVVGIGIGFESPRGSPVLGDARPTFPIRYDLSVPAHRLMARLGHLKTPTSVLLDSLGRPVMVVPPLEEDSHQQHAATLVRSYLRRLSETGTREEVTDRSSPDQPEKEIAP